MIRKILSARADRSVPEHNVEHRADRGLDPRFRDYVALYNNLDNLLWRLPGYLITGIVGAIGFLGSYLTINFRELAPIRLLLVAVLIFFLALLIKLATFCIWSIRQSHTSVGDYLKHMESAGGFDGYFATRPSLKEDNLLNTYSSVAVIVFSFNVITVILLIAALGLGFYAVSQLGWVNFEPVLMYLKSMIDSNLE